MGNLFSIQYSVFFAVVTILCIDSILYIYINIYIIYNNYLQFITTKWVTIAKKTEY